MVSEEMLSGGCCMADFNEFSCMHGTLSSKGEVKISVPQGYILGLLLFLSMLMIFLQVPIWH